MEEWNLREREGIQLVTDFMADPACNEVEFYMEMVMEDQQTFEGLMEYLKMLSTLGTL